MYVRVFLCLQTYHTSVNSLNIFFGVAYGSSESSSAKASYKCFAAHGLAPGPAYRTYLVDKLFLAQYLAEWARSQETTSLNFALSNPISLSHCNTTLGNPLTALSNHENNKLGIHGSGPAS